MLFEQAVEVGEVVKAYLHGDVQNGIPGGKQQSACHGQPVVVEIFRKGGSHGIFEKLHEMGLTDMQLLCHVLDGNSVHIVCLDVFYDELHLFYGFLIPFDDLHFPVIGKKNMKHQIQLALDDKLIGRRIGAAYHVGGINAVRNFVIMGHTRSKMGRNVQRAVIERLKIVVCTDVRLFGLQHIQLEYDIDVFHGSVLILVDGMDLTGTDEDDASGADRVFDQVDGHDSLSAANADDFHFLVPVCGDGVEIQRNGAGKCRIREEIGYMVLFFLIAFVFQNVHGIPPVFDTQLGVEAFSIS